MSVVNLFLEGNIAERLGRVIISTLSAEENGGFRYEMFLEFHDNAAEWMSRELKLLLNEKDKLMNFVT